MKDQNKPQQHQGRRPGESNDPKDQASQREQPQRRDQPGEGRDRAENRGSNQGTTTRTQNTNRPGIDDEDMDEPQGQVGEPTAGGSDIKKKTAATPSHDDVNRDERGRTNQKSGPRTG